MSTKKKKGKKRGPPKLSVEEVFDSEEQLIKKSGKLAQVIKHARSVLVYTGAGISTSACIPDYRGPNGVWTKAEQGIQDVESADPVHACPTYTHMALRELYKQGYVRHILSQNCDGFHLRSGLPQSALSEVHGNMHIEVCKKCDPVRQYVRSYDVTEKTRFRQHRTGRRCDLCNWELNDTIVHFGEVGSLEWPLNWKGTTDVLQEGNCDVILCLGTSLKILQKYKWLWSTHLHLRLRPKVYIINLQATPKDKAAKMRIHGYCDNVMQRIMEELQIKIPQYCRQCDPVLSNTRYRNSRQSERLSRLTECLCVVPSTNVEIPASTSESSPTHVRKRTPGWWGAGLKNSQAKKRNKKPVGRPAKKRKLSKNNSTVAVDSCIECSSESSVVLESASTRSISSPGTLVDDQQILPANIIEDDVTLLVDNDQVLVRLNKQHEHTELVVQNETPLVEDNLIISHMAGEVLDTVQFILDRVDSLELNSLS